MVTSSAVSVSRTRCSDGASFQNAHVTSSNTPIALIASACCQAGAAVCGLKCEPCPAMINAVVIAKSWRGLIGQRKRNALHGHDALIGTRKAYLAHVCQAARRRRAHGQDRLRRIRVSGGAADLLIFIVEEIKRIVPRRDGLELYR